MAITSKRAVGGRNRSSSSLSRSGLGNVQTSMNIDPGQKDIFGGVKQAFSIDDLRQAMRRRGGSKGSGGGSNQANADRRQQIAQAKEMMTFQQKLQQAGTDRQRRQILELATQVGGDARTPGIQPRGAAATQFGMTQIAPYMASLFGGQAGAGAGGSSKAGGMIKSQAPQAPATNDPLGLQYMGPNERRAAQSKLLGSREEGGGIPKTGIYQLHEGEQVVPAPEKLQEMVMDMIVDRQMGDSVGSKGKKKRGKKGKKEKGYEEGTVKSYEDGTGGIQAFLEQLLGMEENADYSEYANPLQAASPMIGSAQQGGMIPEELIPSTEAPSTGPGLPPEAPADIGPYGNPLPESQDQGQSQGDIRLPLTPPPSTPESIPSGPSGYEGELTEDASKASPGTGYSGSFGESKGTEGGKRTFTLKGSEYTLDKRLADRMEQSSQQIDLMNDEAASHTRAAGDLRMYANKRPNSPASERLRAMAGEREKQAKELGGNAKLAQSQMDAILTAQGEQQATREAAGIEAQGKVGAAQLTAGGRVEAARVSSEGDAQGDIVKGLTELMKSYAGMEDADPEAREAALQEIMQRFMMMSAFREAFSGGVGG